MMFEIVLIVFAICTTICFIVDRYFEYLEKKLKISKEKEDYSRANSYHKLDV